MKKLLKKYGRRRIGQMGGKRKGFTLIELLIVLTILAILVAVVAISLTTFVGRGKEEACKTDQRTLQTAVIAFYSEAGYWPTASGVIAGSGGAGEAIDYDAVDGSDGTFAPTYVVEVPDSQADCDWEVDEDQDGQVVQSFANAALATQTCECAGEVPVAAD